MSDQEKKPLPNFKMSMVKVIGNGTPCVMSKVREKKNTYGPDKICMRKKLS